MPCYTLLITGKQIHWMKRLSQIAQRLRAEMLSRENGKDASTPGADGRTIREYNHLLVLNSVRLQGPIARVAISQQTGLSKTTVSSIIDELLADTLVTEGDYVESAPTGGRRAILVNFNADAGIVLGVDVGRTSITLVATNLAGEIKTFHTETFDITADPAACIPIIVASIRIFLAKAALSWDQIVGIGVGMPGTIDFSTHTFMRPPTLEGWDGVDLPSILVNEFRVPSFIDNDANLGALGEGRYGIGKGNGDFVYVRIGTGIGCGLIRNQQVYRGASGLAGELGHIQIEDGGTLCACGNQGCLERYVDDDAIIGDAIHGHSLRKSPLAPRVIPPSPLARFDEVDLNDVIHAASAGDLASRAALQAAGRRMGVALSTLINLLNPEAVVLEGEAVHSSPLFLEALTESALRGTLPMLWPRTPLHVGRLGDLAIALGAATLVIDAAFLPLTTESPMQFTRMFP